MTAVFKEPTLFPESEMFQDDRPTQPTEKQLKALYTELATKIKAKRWSTEKLGDIIEALEAYSYLAYMPYEDDDDFVLKLEQHDIYRHYTFTDGLIELLQDIPSRESELITANEELWVKAKGIKPLFLLGDILHCHHPYDDLLKIDGVYVVADHDLNAGYYCLDESNNKKEVSLHLKYEDVERSCTKVSKSMVS